MEATTKSTRGILLLGPLLLTAGLEPRTIDGSANNPSDPDMGAANTVLARVMPADYGPSGWGGDGRPGPREISNAVVADPGRITNEGHASDYVWQWGQFLDHDLDLTGAADPAEYGPIPVPAGDPHFDPDGNGDVVIDFHRSVYQTVEGSREQMNLITAWIDASNVYGSDAARANELRSLDDTGRLKTSPGDLLPFNTAGFPNAGGPDPGLFLAGDVRANEQVGLTALHTLFVREHNRLADEIRQHAPELGGDEIYELARALVGAQMQVITYREFLPTLLGHGALRDYQGYDPNVDASISNLFSTASYRFGHSMVSRMLKRFDAHGDEIPEGHLELLASFFRPDHILQAGIDPILRGLAWQHAERADPFIADDLRNFLFGPPGSGGFDLASLNIQRGRDHGLPDYNSVRVAMGLAAAGGFSDVSSDPEIQTRLASIYASPDEMDPWVGGLAEDHRPGALVGELVYTVLKEQFEALRDGDRFWYQHRFQGRVLRWLERQRLSKVIRRNTDVGKELGHHVFEVPRKHRHEPQP